MGIHANTVNLTIKRQLLLHAGVTETGAACDCVDKACLFRKIQRILARFKTKADKVRLDISIILQVKQAHHKFRKLIGTCSDWHWKYRTIL